MNVSKTSMLFNKEENLMVFNFLIFIHLTSLSVNSKEAFTLTYEILKTPGELFM